MSREFQYPLSHIRTFALVQMKSIFIGFGWCRGILKCTEIECGVRREQKKFSVNRNNERNETLESNELGLVRSGHTHTARTSHIRSKNVSDKKASLNSRSISGDINHTHTHTVKSTKSALLPPEQPTQQPQPQENRFSVSHPALISIHPTESNQ